MKLLTLQSALVGLYAARALATPMPMPVLDPDVEVNNTLEDRGINVEVQMSGATIVGRSLLSVDTFNAIPYADPPVGPLRLKPPKKFSGKLTRHDGRGIAPACPQFFISADTFGLLGKLAGDILQIPFLKDFTKGTEDCLTINVQRPAGTKAGDKLPVLFWMFGGGFQLGATNTYDATSLMATAVGQGQPFIFVAVNYRIGGFGFMPGKEVLKDGSANLGHLDQRMGLEWVADNIEAFGGDPSKVTIWGQSAGSISVFNQMSLYDGNANYKGKALFRGAIMNSGSIVPADPVDCPKGQAVYDEVVREAGCSRAADTLDCLRKLSFDEFYDAANSVPSIFSESSIALSYLPRPDGKILTDSADKLAKAGKYHAVPMIIGDQEDEGTIFAVTTHKVNTADEMVDFLSKYFFHRAPQDKLTELVDLYEGDGKKYGSPFRTSSFNQLYFGFKRVAAILGDLSFTLTRRVFLDLTTAANPDVPSWSYLSSYDHGLPFAGTFHASDIIQVFYGIKPNNAMRSCRTYYFNFLYNLDPNKGVTKFANWPLWKEAKKLMWFETGSKNSYLDDNFRSEAGDFLVENSDILML